MVRARKRKPPASRRTLREQFLLPAVLAAITALVTAIVATPIQEVIAGWFADNRGEPDSASPASTAPVEISTRYAHDWLTVSWVLPDLLTTDEERRLRALTPADGHDAVDAVLADHEAVVVGECGLNSCDEATSWIEVTVVGAQDDPVLLTGMQAVEIVPGPPLTGTLITEPGGGPFDNIQLVIELDSANPVARHLDPTGELAREPYFQSKSVSLARGEPIRFVIRAVTGSQYYEWKLGIEIMVDGTPTELVVGDDHGDPFRTTALVDEYQAEYGASCTDCPYQSLTPAG